MNFSEFIRLLGADPSSQDPAFLRARDSSPEFSRAAEESDRRERKLRRALELPVPDGLLGSLREIPDSAPAEPGRLRFFASAASLLVLVAVAVLTWRSVLVPFDSVEEYVAYHYDLDGRSLVLLGNNPLAENVEEILAEFNVFMTPELNSMVTVVKICPTPDGDGVHMVLNTDQGLITLIFMPKTAVIDGEIFEFDDMQAQLVSLAVGSAAIVGTDEQQVSALYNLVQTSIRPLGTEA